MTLLALARLCAFWTVWNATPVQVADPEPPRIIGPKPSLIQSDDTHLGVRWNSDAISDQALSMQLRAPWISL